TTKINRKKRAVKQDEENVAGAMALHGVAGFQGRSRVGTAHPVEAGGELPVVVIFVDTDEHVNRVLPKVREMAAHRLMARENVRIEQGSLDQRLLEAHRDSSCQFSKEFQLY